jgi:voltage-gated potassium channel
MTTVGYGDLTPKTAEGKAIAIIVMVVGIGFASLVTGAMAQRFIHRRVHETELTEEELLVELKEVSTRQQHLERTIAQRLSIH